MTLCSLFLFSCIFAYFVHSQRANGAPQKFSAPVFHTYPGMTNAGVTGTMIYDLSAKTIAFKYPVLGYTEIYSFNPKLGYQSGSDQYTDQSVWKVAPFSACTPCAQYGNNYGFPLLNNTNWPLPSGVSVSSNTAGTVSGGCRRYDTPVAIKSFASYFFLDESTGNLCSLADQNGRVWTVTGATSTTYDPALITAPEGCKCLKPIDIAISLDRSSSISTPSTSFYRDFVQQLSNSFYFNSSDAANTAQLSITQWGTEFWSLQSIGNLNFTTSPENVNTASGLIGCTTRSGNCDFCYSCNNKKRDFEEVLDEDEEFSAEDAAEEGESSQWWWTRAPTAPTRAPTRSPTSPTRSPTAPTKAPTRAPTNPTRAPTSAPSNCYVDQDECAAGQWTCTGCGIRGMSDQFTRPQTTYINRTKASKISIVITDGNSNTRYLGNGGDSCTRESNKTTSKIGCYYDIHVQRQYLLAAVPGIETFAIGVSNDIDTTTLDYISGDPSRSFKESSFETLLANLQKYVLGFCPLPDPITECGRCCGFCECGQCVAPTDPIPAKFCDSFEVTGPNAGGCYTTIPRAPCGNRNCNTVRCNNATNTCDYTNLCAPGSPGLNPCFSYTCAVQGGFASCEPTTYNCIDTPNSACPCPVDYTNAPTAAPTAPTPAPTTQPTTPPVDFPTPAPTAGPTAPIDPCEGNQCSSNSFCNATGSCVCTNNYTGVLCGVPPDVDLCKNDTDCFSQFCITSVCVVGSNGGKICQNSPKMCDDGDACTDDFCLADSGCHFVPINCDDGLGCTDDACVAGVCENVRINCSYLDDACHTSYCDDFALTDEERCLKQAVVCERVSNCSISECRLEDNGCVSEEYTCTPVYFGVVAGVAAGVIGGVVAAGAFILCAAATAGGGYAVSKNYDHASDGAVHVSPLYKQSTKTGVGMAH